MYEIAADMRKGLLARAVSAGLQIMQQLMEVNATAACRPRGKKDVDRAATRSGTERGSVTLGSRRAPVARTLGCATAGTDEVPAYELFNSTELLRKMAMKRLGELNTRRYPIGLEPVGQAVELASRSTRKSAVSRKFVTMNEHALADMLGKGLSPLDLVAFMIDGVYFAEHLCVVALSIDGDGTKHPLGLTEWSTENTTVVKGLLTALAKELDKTHRGVASSPREGIAETLTLTLTVLHLDVPPTLTRTFRSANAIESMISISCDHSRNVRRCRDGQMALRWCAAGIVEASKQFRRVNGHLHLSPLRAAPERHVEAETVNADCNTQERECSLMLAGPPPKFHGTRNILVTRARGYHPDIFDISTQLERA